MPPFLDWSIENILSPPFVLFFYDPQNEESHSYRIILKVSTYPNISYMGLGKNSLKYVKMYFDYPNNMSVIERLTTLWAYSYGILLYTLWKKYSWDHRFESKNDIYLCALN